MKSDEKELLQQVQKYKDSDPEVIDQMKKEVKVWPTSTQSIYNRFCLYITMKVKCLFVVVVDSCLIYQRSGNKPYLNLCLSVTLKDEFLFAFHWKTGGLNSI